jgi:hypothetical protein
LLWLGQREKLTCAARGFGIRHMAERLGPEDVRGDDQLMPYEAPEDPADAGPSDRQNQQELPVQSRVDCDIAWGEQAEPDESRLYRDRPPHWDSE